MHMHRLRQMCLDRLENGDSMLWFDAKLPHLEPPNLKGSFVPAGALQWISGCHGLLADSYVSWFLNLGGKPGMCHVFSLTPRKKLWSGGLRNDQFSTLIKWWIVRYCTNMARIPPLINQTNAVILRTLVSFYHFRIWSWLGSQYPSITRWLSKIFDLHPLGEMFQYFSSYFFQMSWVVQPPFQKLLVEFAVFRGKNTTQLGTMIITRDYI